MHACVCFALGTKSLTLSRLPCGKALVAGRIWVVVVVTVGKSTYTMLPPSTMANQTCSSPTVIIEIMQAVAQEINLQGFIMDMTETQASSDQPPSTQPSSQLSFPLLNHDYHHHSSPPPPSRHKVYTTICGHPHHRLTLEKTVYVIHLITCPCRIVNIEGCPLFAEEM